MSDNPADRESASQAQMQRFVADLKEARAREKQQAAATQAAYAQLSAYARDVKTAWRKERQRAEQLERAYLNTLQVLLRASAYKDEETGAHIARIRHYSKTLCLAAGLGEDLATLVYDASPMHDVGKIGVPDVVLKKPGSLDPDEWKIMSRHPAIGASLLNGTGSALLEAAREIALTHHERWDGSGYPNGVVGEAIPLLGRVVNLVDQYDALRSPRVYKPAFTHERTCEIMLKGDGRSMPAHFDPNLLAAFGDTHLQLAAVYERFCEGAPDALGD